MINEETNIKQQITKKLAYFSVLIIAIFVVAYLKIFYIWLNKPKYLKNQFYYTIKNIEAIRGDILDIKGRVLATTETKYTIYFDPNTDYLRKYKVLDTLLNSLCDSLKKVLPKEKVNELKDNIQKARVKKIRQVLIARDVDYFTYKRMEKFPIFKLGKIKGGFLVKKEQEPVLLHKNLARRTIGFKTKNELQEFTGIQKSMNSYLKGIEGKAWFQNLGNNLYLEHKIINYPQNGNDVVSTIDINLQDLAHKILHKRLVELQAKSGVLILMDVKTAEIRALVNLSKISDSIYDEIENYAISKVYEPGSVIKLATMIAILEKNPSLTLDTKIFCENGVWEVLPNKVIIKDHNYKDGGYGEITVTDIFKYSSNIGIAKLVKMTFQKNYKEFIDRLGSLKLITPLNLGFDNEPKPFITTPKNTKWSNVASPLRISFGYEISTTPMHLIMLYNAVANNGIMLKPNFVKYILNNDKIIREFKPETLDYRICSPKTLKTVQFLMKEVVEEGTGKNYVKSDLISIAGKSGTADMYSNGEYRKDSVETTFIAYFPADKPKYTCLVWIHNPQNNKSGSAAAGPVIKQIAEAIYSYDPDLHNRSFIVNNYPKITDKFPSIATSFYPPLQKALNFNNISYKKGNYKFVDPKINNNQIDFQPIYMSPQKVPNVIGMNARDAVFTLELVGLKVNIYGFGRVIKQVPEANSPLPNNKTVKIYLNQQL